jgi:hypothetical protein
MGVSITISVVRAACHVHGRTVVLCPRGLGRGGQRSRVKGPEKTFKHVQLLPIRRHALPRTLPYRDTGPGMMDGMLLWGILEPLLC